MVWGQYDDGFDVPKSKIIAFGRNVILGMNYQDEFQYQVDRDEPVPAGEPVDSLAE